MDEIFADKFKSESELTDWIISFYRNRLIYFRENYGHHTENGTLINNHLLDITRKRYIQLLSRKHSATNGELRRENK